MSREPEYLNTQTIAEVYDFPSRDAVRMWLKRHGVPCDRIGNRLRVLRASCEAHIKRNRKRRTA